MRFRERRYIHNKRMIKLSRRGPVMFVLVKDKNGMLRDCWDNKPSGKYYDYDELLKEISPKEWAGYAVIGKF